MNSYFKIETTFELKMSRFTRRTAILEIGDERYVYRRDLDANAGDLDQSAEIFTEGEQAVVQEPENVELGAAAVQTNGREPDIVQEADNVELGAAGVQMIEEKPAIVQERENVELGAAAVQMNDDVDPGQGMNHI